MKRSLLLMLIAMWAVILLNGCTPVERQAYDVAVASKAFLDSERQQHPECATGTTSTVCTDVAKAVGAKDFLLDAISAYCAGPEFNTGGKCNPPAKGTPAAQQAAEKLKAAIANYNQAAADLKAATGGK